MLRHKYAPVYFEIWSIRKVLVTTAWIPEQSCKCSNVGDWMDEV